VIASAAPRQTVRAVFPHTAFRLPFVRQRYGVTERPYLSGPATTKLESFMYLDREG
jgi:hypothetical protein